MKDNFPNRKIKIAAEWYCKTPRNNEMGTRHNPFHGFDLMKRKELELKLRMAGRFLKKEKGSPIPFDQSKEWCE